MKEMGFSKHLVKLLEGLYNNQKATIRWNKEHTEPFTICKGVRQGCILSPHLFSTYTEKIMRDAEVDNYGIKIGGRPIYNQRYADDTALCADNHEVICQLLNNINEKGKLKTMKLNAKKIKVIYIGILIRKTPELTFKSIYGGIIQITVNLQNKMFYNFQTTLHSQ